jgi:hypothetical protein
MQESKAYTIYGKVALTFRSSAVTVRLLVLEPQYRRGTAWSTFRWPLTPKASNVGTSFRSFSDSLHTVPSPENTTNSIHPESLTRAKVYDHRHSFHSTQVHLDKPPSR